MARTIVPGRSHRRATCPLAGVTAVSSFDGRLAGCAGAVGARLVLFLPDEEAVILSAMTATGSRPPWSGWR